MSWVVESLRELLRGDSASRIDVLLIPLREIGYVLAIKSRIRIRMANSAPLVETKPTFRLNCSFSGSRNPGGAFGGGGSSGFWTASFEVVVYLGRLVSGFTHAAPSGHKYLHECVDSELHAVLCGLGNCDCVPSIVQRHWSSGQYEHCEHYRASIFARGA